MSVDETNKESSGDLAVNMVAMLAQTGTPTGPVPTSAELQQYFEGRVTVQRIAEIESHLAHSPAVMDAYLALVGSDLKRHVAVDVAVSERSSVASSTLGRLQDWLASWQRPLVAVGASLAAGAVALNLLVFGAGDDGTQSIRVRSLRPDRPDTEVQESADWRENAFASALRTGRPASQPCFTEDCAAESRAISELGVLTATLAAACESGRNADSGLVARARALSSDIEVRAWRALASRVAEAAESGRAGCGTIGDIAAGER